MIEYANSKGSFSRTRKLNAEQIQDIRKRFDAGEDPAAIGERYKITKRYAVRVGRREVWKSLKDKEEEN